MRGPEVPYVERRGSIYRVRFRVPCDLAEQTGLVEIRRSLQTSDLKIAHRRALAARTWFADVVGMLRAKDRPSRADLEQAARLYFEQLQKRIDVQRPFEDETLGQEIDWNLEETRERVRDLDNQLRTNRFGPGVRANAVEMLQSLSLTIPQLSEDLQRLSMQLAARAEREQMRYLEHQLSVPNSSFDPEDDAFHSRSSAVEGSVGLSEPQRQSCTLRENIDQYIRAKERRGLGQSQLDEIGRALNWLVEEIGRETPLAQIRKDQLRHFRDNLQLIDVTLRGREQPFRQRLTNIEANQIRSVTSSRYWRSVAAFFAWATAEGLINQNPAAGLRIEPRKGETKNSPEPFSEGELRKLFATPLYAGYKSPKRKSEAGNLRRRDGHWWSGILPLFTGLRAGELSQLLPSDFAFEAPIPHLKIREENGSGERTKRAKTAASIRDVPLVPMLLDLGLQEFVQMRAKLQPQGRVFREFRLGAGDRLSDGMTKFWSPFLRKWGLHRAGRSTHVMRHTFVAGLRANGVSEDEIGGLVGHAPKSITGTYGGAFPLSRKREAALRLNYGFDILEAVGGPYDPSTHALLPDN